MDERQLEEEKNDNHSDEDRRWVKQERQGNHQDEGQCYSSHLQPSTKKCWEKVFPWDQWPIDSTVNNSSIVVLLTQCEKRRRSLADSRRLVGQCQSIDFCLVVRRGASVRRLANESFHLSKFFAENRLLNQWKDRFHKSVEFSPGWRNDPESVPVDELLVAVDWKVCCVVGLLMDPFHDQSVEMLRKSREDLPTNKSIDLANATQEEVFGQELSDLSGDEGTTPAQTHRRSSSNGEQVPTTFLFKQRKTSLRTGNWRSTDRRRARTRRTNSSGYASSEMSSDARHSSS